MRCNGFCLSRVRDRCARPNTRPLWATFTCCFALLLATAASASGDIIGHPYPGGGGNTGGNTGGGGGDGGGGGGGGGSGNAPRPTIVTIDRANDNLLSIDPYTGQMSIIGPIGRDMVSPHLTFMNGRLFALNMDTVSRTELVEIDLTTGAALSAYDVTRNGQIITFAEGLANNGSDLFIAYRSSTQGQSSNALGRLSLNGVISNDANLNTINPLADIDGMVFDTSAGHLIGTDTRIGENSISFFHVNNTPPTYSLLSQFTRNSSIQSINDMDYLNGFMVALDDVTRRLHWIDPTNGSLLHSVNLTGASELRGLAVVPGPGSLVAFTLGLTLHRGRRRRA